MRAAFAVWNGRIAPVFDVARQIHLVEAESGGIVNQWTEVLPEEMPVQRALRLTELGVENLICGAVSRPLQALVSAYGIRVTAFIAGGADEVIQAWLEDRLDGEEFAMPGCCGRRKPRGCRSPGGRAARPGKSRGRAGGAEKIRPDH
ncbi:MAG: NifB/NifX family molybdenum-iron cluster-binding protein [Desulfobacteraceae bacterium]